MSGISVAGLKRVAGREDSGMLQEHRSVSFVLFFSGMEKKR